MSCSDRKSTRLNSSHLVISYAVFCLKKKNDAREIPNYWAYAQNFVLQDDMFASSSSWSLPEHLYMVSGWSAVCPQVAANPLDCVNSLDPKQPGRSWNGPLVPGKATYAWTDITYLLKKSG